LKKIDTLPSAKLALFLLFLVSFFNYMDRYVLAILLPSIKADLQVSDTLLGFLGTAFTIAYIVLGIPIAGLADRYSRKKIITAALTIWSLMTALCGITQNFMQLAIARVFVGVGEAGATPPAHSIISDYFPFEKRAKAIAIHTLGGPVGIFIGFILAGYLAETYGWRIAFLCLGLPGLVLALIVALKLVEPKRGQNESDELAVEVEESPGFIEAIRTLLSSPTFRHLSIGTGYYTVIWLGVIGWLPSYFVRSFDMSVTEAGFWLAVSLGISQIIGILAGGVLTDHMIKKDVRWYGWIAAGAMLFSTPLFVIVFITDSGLIAGLALFPAFLIGIFQGPASITAIQGLAHLRMRAMAPAMFFFTVNLIGGTLGPLLGGWFSDQLAGTYGDESLRYSLLILSIVFGLLAFLHYMLSARTMRAEIRTG
jgi:MFS family permease